MVAPVATIHVLRQLARADRSPGTLRPIVPARRRGCSGQARAWRRVL